MFTEARQKPVLLERIAKMNDDIANYQLSISSLKTALDATDAKDSAMKLSYAREIEILNSQKADYEGRVKELEKQLRRANRRAKLAAFGGLVLSGGVAWLVMGR